MYTVSRCVYHQEKEVGEVLCSDNYSDSIYETVLAIKLRIQEGMGIPTDSITIYRTKRYNIQGYYITVPRTKENIMKENEPAVENFYIEIKYN